MRARRSLLVISGVLTPVLGAQRPAAAGVVTGPLGMRADSVVRAAASRGFSGVVRIDAHGTTVLEKGYGLANRRLGVAFSPRTIVQIGSNTKDFTAVAVLKLQDRGLLNVRDSLGKYFPDAPADKRGITLLQVMQHRAGFPDFVSPAGVRDADFEPVGRDEFLRRLMTQPLAHEPGGESHYSNAGYGLLAALIERLTHASYDAFVQQNIFLPLGMRNTGFALPAFDERLMAHGYRHGADIGTILSHPHPPDGPYWNLRGNGGMSSTLDDMHTFYEALFTTEKLLKPETRAVFFLGDEVGLAGSDNVSYFSYDRFPRLGFEIIIASNNSEAPAPAVRRALVKALELPGDDEGPPPAAGPAHTPAPEIARLLQEFIRVLNGGDTTQVRSFMAEHFALDPSGPPLDTRVRRLLGASQDFGQLTIKSMNQREDGRVDVAASAARQGDIVIRAEMTVEPTPRIRSIGILRT